MGKLSAGFLACWAALAADDPGERLYQAQCAYCHGPRGEGGRGATLARSRLRHAPDDAALHRVISRGIPDTGMPGNSMSAREVEHVAGYVKSLGRVAQPPLPGDPQRGQQIYSGKGGCSECHTIAGRGGPLGPDLTDIGARRSAAHLRASLTDPEADLPDGFLQLRLVTRAGHRLTGVRIDEDTFSIRIRDLSGAVLSFWKSELAELHRDRGKSPMPGYRGPALELDDLVAYLASLQEAR